MVKQNNNRMNKKGFIDGFSLVAFIIVVGSVVGGTYSVLNDNPNQKDFSSYYVADMSLHIYYNYSCVNQVPEQSRGVFETKEPIDKLNYTYKECNLK